MNTESLFNQINIETLYSNYNQTTYYKQLIEDSGVMEHIQLLQIPDREIPILKKLLLISLLHIRTVPQTLIACLTDDFPTLQEASDYLEKVITVYNLIDYDTQYCYTKINLSQEAQNDINNYGYPLPLSIPPKPVLSNTDTGYYSPKKGTILQSDNYSQYDINLDVINQLNSIPLAFNDDLKTKVPLARPTKPEQLTAHSKFVKHLHSSRSILPSTIYLTHGYDLRGRIYARGYHYNYQSHDWCKATLSFAETFTYKTCTHCNQVLTLDHFYKRSKGNTHESICKSCRSTKYRKPKLPTN